MVCKCLKSNTEKEFKEFVHITVKECLEQETGLVRSIEQLKTEILMLNKKIEDLNAANENLQKDKQELEIVNCNLQIKLTEVEAVSKTQTSQLEELEKVRLNEYEKFSVKCNYFAEQLQKSNFDNEKLKKQLQDYTDNYGYFEELLLEYKKLPLTVRQELYGILGEADNPFNFICHLSQLDHFNKLYDYLQYELNRQGLSDEVASYLIKVYNVSFTLVNKSKNEPVYVMHNILIGSRFDDEKMVCFARSKQLGKIKHVLLQGYDNARTGKVVATSLVELE